MFILRLISLLEPGFEFNLKLVLELGGAFSAGECSEEM